MGGPIAFEGFGAAENQGIAFGGVLPQYSHTLVFALGGPIAFGTFGMVPLSYGIPSLSPSYASIDDCSYDVRAASNCKR